MDRFIQQTILQMLTPIFDAHFSSSSYGFRLKRQAHDAVRQAQKYIQEGYRYVVDIDLEKFFDRVNHDILMSRVARKVEDKRVLKLIRAYLKAGVMLEGVRVRSEEGTPQGGPLSPLLANILLDDLDKELEKRGLKFYRYANDCNIYVRSARAGQRVKQSVQKYLEMKLKLKVNKEKSAVDRPWKQKFLEFSFTSQREALIRFALKSVQRFKNKIRQLKNPNWSLPMEECIQKINQYTMGWLGYFALIETPSPLKRLEEKKVETVPLAPMELGENSNS